jgi:hypothetical protein
MLTENSHVSRIEVLSLSQDSGQIAQCFFRDGEPRKHTKAVNLVPHPFQIESTLEALAEECRRTPAFEYVWPIFV